MTETRLLIRDDPDHGPGSRRLGFSCPHGASSALLLPGRDAVADGIVVDVLLARHSGVNHCSCAPAPPSADHRRSRH